MHQACEYFKRPLTISDNDWDHNKLRQPCKNAIKSTVAPRRYPKTGLWTTNMEMNIAAIALNANKRRWDCILSPHLSLCCRLQCLVRLYCRHAPFTESLHEYHDVQGLLSSICMDSVMLIQHVEPVMAIIYRSLMTQKQRCPPTMAMTLNYIS